LCVGSGVLERYTACVWGVECKRDILLVSAVGCQKIEVAVCSEQYQYQMSWCLC
jgi:hypothetical protein